MHLVPFLPALLVPFLPALRPDRVNNAAQADEPGKPHLCMNRQTQCPTHRHLTHLSGQMTVGRTNGVHTPNCDWTPCAPRITHVSARHRIPLAISIMCISQIHCNSMKLLCSWDVKGNAKR